jgi:hypothetical protein
VAARAAPRLVIDAVGEMDLEPFYAVYKGRKCTPHRRVGGPGLVDDGSGHLVRNESGQPAQDVSVILAPCTSRSAPRRLGER